MIDSSERYRSVEVSRMAQAMKYTYDSYVADFCQMYAVAHLVAAEGETPARQQIMEQCAMRMEAWDESLENGRWV
jgi:hypothetical protein